jgi:glycerol uptake facilitator-like aquaporin
MGNFAVTLGLVFASTAVAGTGDQLWMYALADALAALVAALFFMALLRYPGTPPRPSRH